MKFPTTRAELWAVFDQAWVFGAEAQIRSDLHQEWERSCYAFDRLYPKQTITRPRVITLSYGNQYRMVNGRWEYDKSKYTGKFAPEETGRDWAPYKNNSSPHAATREDAAKILDVWDKPNETVEIE